MVSRQLLFYLSIILTLIYKTSSSCNKVPEGVAGPKNRNVAGKYIIEISGNPKEYTPSQIYKIFLKTNPRAYPQKSFRNFMITLEPDDNNNDDLDVGQLDIAYDSDTLAKFSTTCPNTVIDSSTVFKSEIQIYWTAPPSGNGCINIKATVVESNQNWYSEDEGLTKRICEDENIQPTAHKKCCACDEAKYEVAFEGKWTRNTHPRHFPRHPWVTKFSDVIGASHQWSHAFWQYNGIATDGLKDLADTGNTKTLESELKNNSENIRTIIKARGLQYPNITKSTYAVFRVDKKNHLVSLVAKIIPSPDWIVGVSDFELCREDCTWEESKTLNLYPWDVGTNDGIGYESSLPLQDWQPIRKITPNNPSDPKSPFYNEDGDEMKPIAKLHLTRQRVYTKTCEVEEEEKADCTNSEECVDNEEAEDAESTEKSETCEDCDEDSNCPPWGEWSDCDASCGKGKETRRRIYENDDDEHNCLQKQERDCEVPCDEEKTSSDAFGGLQSSSIIIQQPTGKVINCKVSRWSHWSECKADNGKCGKGYKYKYRKIKVERANGGKKCPKKLFKRKRCMLPCSTLNEIEECVMSNWSNWTPCLSQSDKSAVQIRTRQILYQPRGVEECPARMEQRHCSNR